MARRPKNEIGAELAQALMNPNPAAVPSPVQPPAEVDVSRAVSAGSFTFDASASLPQPVDPFAGIEIPMPDFAASPEELAQKEAARKASVQAIVDKTMGMNPAAPPPAIVNGEMSFKDLAFSLTHAGFRVTISDIAKWPLVQRLQTRAWLEDFSTPAKPTPDFLLAYLPSRAEVMARKIEPVAPPPSAEPLPATKARLGYERKPDGNINNCALALGLEEGEEKCQICKGLCPDKARLVNEKLVEIGRLSATLGVPVPPDLSTIPVSAPPEPPAAFVGGPPPPPLFAEAHGGEIAPDFQRIVEAVYAVDAYADYADLEKNLEVGDQRGDRATLREHLDMAERRARRAHRLWLSAKLERARWEHGADKTRAAMRAKATEELEAEKAAGDRKKMITDADVIARMSEIFGDEYHAQEITRHKLKGVENSIEDLVARWSSRAASLRTLLETLR